MNNLDEFIKYLDGQLSEEEKVSFEKLLQSRKRMREEFDDFEKKYTISKSDVETDFRYFSSLSARAKTRIETPNPSVLTKKNIVVPGIVSFVLFLIIIISFFEYDNDSAQLVDQDELYSEELLDEYLDSENFIISENYAISNSELEDLYLENLEFDESLFNFIENSLSPSDIDGELYETLSEVEFNNVYQELEKKKIL